MRTARAVWPAVFLVAALELSLAGLLAAENTPALMDAVKRNDAAAVRTLLSTRADANTREADGTTPLHWAAHRDAGDIATLLIRAGSNVNAATELGVTPLALACANGSGTMVDTLLAAGADARAALANGETMLMSCARTGSLPAVRSLLAKGAAPNVKDPVRGQTALMFAVAGRHAAVARLLVERGADVNARSTGGFTPLLFAAREGDLESARLLVAAGADVNMVTPAAESPLLVAAASMVAVSTADYRFVHHPSAHEALATMLIEKGAAVNHADTFGQTALHFAVDTRKIALIRALLKQGADPNLQLTKGLPFRPGDYVGRAGHRGASPFWLAAIAADVEIMRILLEGGANPRLPSSNGTTPFMVAAGLGQTDSRMPPQDRMLEAVKWLLEVDGNVNAANTSGQTAMHGAASVSADGVIEFLASRGGTVNVKDKGGRTPFDLTQSTLRPRPDTAALLRKLEASQR